VDVPAPYTRTIARVTATGATVEVTAVGWGIEIAHSDGDTPATRWTRDDPALRAELDRLAVIDVHPISR
jgi:hypothetical protein